MATPSKGNSTSSFGVGSLVWAKMKGFPPWPGLVSEPPEEMKKQTKKNHQCIFFFGSKNYGWIESTQLKPYKEFKEELSKSAGKAKVAFREACDEIDNYIAKGEPGIQSSTGEEAFDQLVSATAATSKVSKKTPKKEKPKTPKAPKTPEPVSSTSVEAPSTSKRISKKPKKLEGVIPSTSKKRPASPVHSLVREKKKKKVARGGPSGDSGMPKKVDLNTSTRDFAQPPSPQGLPFGGAQRRGPGSNLLDRPPNISRPETPPLNLKDVSQTLREKNITPSPLKFGFLGLGIMGSGIVKNLLNSGHKVIVWNRTPEKYKEFRAAGAETAQTPSDVVQAADITFSCVSDPQAAKDMVFGNCGVLGEINSTKAYVEMTGIDADTSIDLAESITSKGGRYLEAQLQGSKLQAEEGTTVILSAGDRSLYDECHSCFEAFGRSSFFLGDVGNASKMNLVIQLMTGISLAGLAEGMALADRAGLQQVDVLEVISLTALNCPLVAEKGRAIIDGGFPTHLPLQHLQKDLKLSLNLSDQLEQPLPLTASANEVFKHAKRLGYGDHDASAVYIRARF